MGRGSSSSGGGGSGGSSSGGRGWSSSRGRGGSHTTVIIGGRRYYGGGGSSNGSFIPVIIFLAIFAICTLWAGVSTISKANKYGSVDGVALSNRYSGTWYYTTYEYTIKGVEYTNESDVGWELPEDVGKTVTIYYLKSNPDYITDEKPADRTGGAVCLVISGAFIAGTVALINAEIKRNKKRKAEVEIETPITSAPKEDNQIRCHYCGTKYDKNASSCPNCGASNK